MGFPLLDELIDPEFHASLAWLGRVQKRWIWYEPEDRENDLPRTMTFVDWGALRDAPGAAGHADFIGILYRLAKNKSILHVNLMEILARYIADGPKTFRPNAEQWEAMEHVELTIPPADFRSPYPVLTVEPPPAVRGRMATMFDMPTERIPRFVLIHDRRIPGEEHMVTVHTRFGTGVEAVDENFVFMDQKANATIETVLNRRVDNVGVVDLSLLPPAEACDQRCSALMARAAMNLTLMLTHFGSRLGPVQGMLPKANRAARRAAARGGSWQEVSMKQDIVVRAHVPASGLNPPGLGVGGEQPFHWRKGHWRAYPGHGARRAAGETVPLLFVRPCPVRLDRAPADLSASEVVYRS